MTTVEIIDQTIEREGGYSDRAADRGGPTKYGITGKTLATWLGRPVSRQDVQNLDVPTARAIYREVYLKPYAWIADDEIKAFLFDYAVMSWHDDVIPDLQRAAGATVDGKLGPNTRERVSYMIAHNREALYKALYQLRSAKLLRTALDDHDVQEFLKHNPQSQLNNLRGWMNRLAKFV